ncbi:ATPase [Lutimaribacter sp. EGI FJ00015]|uniref:ATPase n=1 Tax=Lutimaribacter degradans TaxID=2945989 RepID=A0ACC5ZYT6_9RHOB|nr:ATP12 family protein [Lutimaribacter sp. EGI FJ00013]MCM2563217.1 ATPase [Lutimaribacter sp. EGI FJ00013]MCO0614460.1 ATPase [Lutimaribacter sp. EGI FJ00015]MCO0635939.1 ATPase [Lutimaribacter sp. EGI FJ00014]
MSVWKAKRFWKEAQVVEEGDGFTVRLDGRPVRTPAKAPLIVPGHDLAAEIAAEWDAQEGEIDPNTMPFTRSANAAIDKVRLQRAAVADMLADYGDSDLLCYRAASPDSLVARQAENWDPLLDWAESEFGGRLSVVEGVMYAAQPSKVMARLRSEVHKFEAFSLTAFHDLVSISGSLILGFAVARDRLEPGTAFDISVIDETWQAEQWGIDDEAAAQTAHKRAAFLHAKRFFDLAGAEKICKASGNALG